PSSPPPRPCFSRAPSLLLCSFCLTPPPPTPTPFPYTTLFRSLDAQGTLPGGREHQLRLEQLPDPLAQPKPLEAGRRQHDGVVLRSEEHTSELQSHLNLVCRLLLEKKKKTILGSTPQPWRD